MKNPYATPADFWQERDFGAKISAVFDFIGMHWRRLGKCLLYFVLPVTLLLGVGLGLMTNTMWNQLGTTMRHTRRGLPAAAVAPSPLAGLNFTGMGMAFLGGTLAVLLVVCTVYGYVRTRLRLPAPEPVTPAAVWAEIRARLGRMLLVIMLGVVAYLLVVGGTLALVGLLARGGGVSGGSVGTLVLAFMGLGVLGAYLGVVFSLYFPVLWLEDISIFAAVGRCFQLIRGQWWATLGLLFIAGLLQGALSIVFIVPQYAVLAGKMMGIPGLDSDVLGVIAQTVYSVGLIVTYCVPLLALAFQYFNLAERREGYGLRLLVNELGQPQGGPTAFSHHYRPDEEGEY